MLKSKNKTGYKYSNDGAQGFFSDPENYQIEDHVSQDHVENRMMKTFHYVG